MQLHPGEQFVIARQLADPFDTDTNYVRAVVRDAKSDTLLKTVNLSDKGSRRFTGVYEVPADVSGQGFWITITTTIYTDSGYSSVNQNYSEEQTTYLVQARSNNLGGSGGGGADVDYSKIRKIIEKVIEEKVKPPKDPEKVNLESITGGLKALSQKIDKIPTEKVEIEPINLLPLVDALANITEMIRLIPTEKPNLDLSGVETAVNDLRTAIDTAFASHDGLAKAAEEKIQAAAEALADQVERSANASYTMTFAPTPAAKRNKEEGEEKPKRDLGALTKALRGK